MQPNSTLLEKSGVSQAIINKCKAIGLVDEKLNTALQLVVGHNVKINSIIQWTKEGMSLERIDTCLQVVARTDFTDSVSFANVVIHCSGINRDQDHSGVVSDHIIDIFESLGEARVCLEEKYQSTKRGDYENRRIPMVDMYILDRMVEIYKGNMSRALRDLQNDPAGVAEKLAVSNDRLMMLVKPDFGYDLV